MTDTPHDNLESRLRDATSWSGPSDVIWKRALAAEPRRNVLAFDVGSFAKRRWFPITCAASAACLAFVLLVKSSTVSAPFMSPSFDYDRPADLKPSASSAPLIQFSLSTPPAIDGNPGLEPTDLAVDPLATARFRFRQDRWSLVRESGSTPSQFQSASQTDAPDSTQSASPAASQRHVIHKATFELTATDVRAAFHKAGLILNEGLGEHLQDSSLTGTGNDASGILTLRVVASRLAEVCNALRDLGVVVSERREGQDVTGQVIDIEARLRNEQRVEKELLELFDQRKDAPLKDVLELRQKLSEVRAGIEQLIAQRDRLGRLVSLATVLVIIRTGEKPPEEPKVESLWHYFGESIKHAWRSGTRGLADTIAALVSIVIGGLIWWILLIVALLLLRRYVKARGAKP